MCELIPENLLFDWVENVHVNELMQKLKLRFFFSYFFNRMLENYFRKFVIAKTALLSL